MGIPIFSHGEVTVPSRGGYIALWHCGYGYEYSIPKQLRDSIVALGNLREMGILHQCKSICIQQSLKRRLWTLRND